MTIDETEIARLAQIGPKMRDEPQAYARALLRMGYEAGAKAERRACARALTAEAKKAAIGVKIAMRSNAYGEEERLRSKRDHMQIAARVIIARGEDNA